MDRPKRERRPPQTYQPEIVSKSTKGYWSLAEKEKLFEALKKHGKDDLNRLERALRPKKSKSQIAHYLQILEKRQPIKARNEEAPIETWLRLSNELTANDADYSDILASAVSICGNLEPHLPSKKSSEVDYPAIYRYLDCLLRGSANFPHMNELTAAILLDILQGMADTLKTMDLSVQRRLMAEKYKLLKGKVSINNPVHYEAARKALENDIELNGVMAMTERIPYPHQVPASAQRFSRWNKRGATPEYSSIGSPSAMQSAAASSSAASPQAAAAGQPPAKRLKLLPGVKITPGTYKLSPKDLQVLLQSLSQPESQPASGTALPNPRVPTLVPICLPGGAKTGEEDGIQGGAEVNVQSAGIVYEQTKVQSQSSAKQVSQGSEEPQGDLQSGAKQVSQGSEDDLQSGAKQVSEGGDEPRDDLQIGAKQVSEGGDEPRSDLQSGAKQVSEGGDEPRSDLQIGAKPVSEGGDEPRSDLQSGANQVSQSGDEPKSDLQSGAKPVSQSGNEPRSDLQSGANQVSQSGDEPRSDLQSGAKQVSQADDELQSGMQSGEKETQEQTGGESRVPNAANCGITMQSGTTQCNTPSRTADSVTAQNDSSQSVTPKTLASKATVQTDVTPSGSTNVTEPVANTPDGIQILDKVVVSPNQVGQSKTAAKLPKRTSLFSLNPLCVPVRYLKPNKIQTMCVYGGMTQDPNV